MSFHVKIDGRDATAKTKKALKAGPKQRAGAKKAALKAINHTLDANRLVKHQLRTK